jgi:hypothetical protein
LPKAKGAIDVVRQSGGKNLPMILLIDFTQFDLGFFKALPTRVLSCIFRNVF